MADLIQATALKKAIAETCALPEWVRALVNCVIDDQETVDAVPVIRCKDCIYANMYIFEKPHYYCPFRKRKEVGADDFCSNAEAEPVNKPVESVDK